ncbi:tetratricopeptide repeat protein [Aquimarina sp. U1-2]|uniref:tetratricopeptide repeat protein n=1 Tax=Aquimarina sp. U1-2 TaxID=2823141 RepID=UPI001AECFECC|nr:tetratricopeptide repeat protein [Aquimarina sp. U1-2]MBP2831155.1 tetratricopeptide repeat protein [Aquimarina sp. U1-2]
MQKSLYLFFAIWIQIVVVCAQETTIIDISIYDQKFPAVEDSIAKYTLLSKDAYRAGNLKTFKAYSNVILAMAKANNLEDTKIRTLVNIAIYYQQTDQYEKSLDTYLEAEKLAEKLPEDSYIKSLIKTNLGNLYIAMGDYEMAIVAMKNVLLLAENHDNPDMFKNVAYSIIGTAYLNQKKFVKALEYMELSKELSIKSSRKDYLISSMINISECYLALHRFEDVLKNGQHILKLIDDKESIESKALTQLTIANAFLGLKKPSKALNPLTEAKEIAISGNFLKIKMNSHHQLSKVYESLGNLKSSLEEQKAYTETRDQYLKTLSKAKRLELEKETKNKTKIITHQEKSITLLSEEKQRYIFLGIVLVALLLVSSIFYWNKRKKLAEKSLQLKDDKLLLQNENEVLKDTLNALALKNQKREFSQKTTEIRSSKKTSLSPEDQKEYMKLILDYMEKKKPYLDHEIKQSDIANCLQISVHLFSEVLNVCFQKNFNSFINLYRVDTAKKMIQNPKFKDYKILAIGYEAGFPSKTSFNRVFKNLVGLTPSEFQKKYS